jgi:hypothetical protein
MTGAAAVTENIDWERIRSTRAEAAGVEGCRMFAIQLGGAKTDGSAESECTRQLK